MLNGLRPEASHALCQVVTECFPGANPRMDISIESPGSLFSIVTPSEASVAPESRPAFHQPHVSRAFALPTLRNVTVIDPNVFASVLPGTTFQLSACRDNTSRRSSFGLKSTRKEFCDTANEGQQSSSIAGQHSQEMFRSVRMSPPVRTISRDYSRLPHGGSGLPRCNPQRQRGRTVTTPSLTLRVTWEP